jgi:hypothetical protein
VRTREPVPPSRLRPQVPRDLETICLKCLHKEPDRRYPSAGTLAEDLRRYLTNVPILAKPIGAWERFAKWIRRRPTLAALVLMIFLNVLLTIVCLVLSISVFEQQSDKGKTEIHISPVPWVVLIIVLLFEYLGWRLWRSSRRKVP